MSVKTLWKQEGFAVISEVRGGDGVDGWIPHIHAFGISAIEAGELEAQARELPEHLRIGLRIVPASLNFYA